MNIKEWHYDAKMKLNKIDSQRFKNLLIPELDFKFNEAIEIFVKMVAQPRGKSNLGFEVTQRTIDDIRTLVVEDLIIPVSTTGIVALPTNYWNYLRSEVSCTKGPCTNKVCRVQVRQHDDAFENSVFDKSSFEWRIVNALFNNNGIKLFTDGTFKVNSLKLSYIKKPQYVHNAEDFGATAGAGTYTLPGGTILTGSNNCELPDHTHREIVDIAVMLLSGELNNPDYEQKLIKMNLNKLN